MQQANCFIKKILTDEAISNESKNNLKKINDNSSINDFIITFKNESDANRIKIYYNECKS